MAKNDFTSWLKATLRGEGIAPSEVAHFASPKGVFKFLKREPRGRYSVGPISISDYSARGLRKEAFPAIERLISRKAVRTRRPIAEIIKEIIPVRQRRVAFEREISHGPARLSPAALRSQ